MWNKKNKVISNLTSKIKAMNTSIEKLTIEELDSRFNELQREIEDLQKKYLDPYKINELISDEKGIHFFKEPIISYQINAS